MPSGPKKRRAERKKNDIITKTSTNPATSETYEEKVVAAIGFQTVDQKTNPETDTYEEKLVAAIEFQTVNQKTDEPPTMIDVENIQTDTSSKKTDPIASDDAGETGLGDLPAIVNAVVIADTVEETFEDPALKPHDLLNLDSQIPLDASNSSEGQLKSCFSEPPAFVHQNSSVGKVVDTSSSDQNQEVGGEMKLLEQLLSISTEIGLNAEKQMSLAKDFSLNLSQILEELKFGKSK